MATQILEVFVSAFVKLGNVPSFETLFKLLRDTVPECALDPQVADDYAMTIGLVAELKLSGVN